MQLYYGTSAEFDKTKSQISKYKAGDLLLVDNKDLYVVEGSSSSNNTGKTFKLLTIPSVSCIRYSLSIAHGEEHRGDFTRIYTTTVSDSRFKSTDKVISYSLSVAGISTIGLTIEDAKKAYDTIFDVNAGDGYVSIYSTDSVVNSGITLKVNVLR